MDEEKEYPVFMPRKWISNEEAKEIWSDNNSITEEDCCEDCNEDQLHCKCL